MDLTHLKHLESLPYATLTAGMLYQLLGPTAKYLGGKTQELAEQSVQNLEKMFANAWKRLADESKERGEVPPRVLRSAMNEGAFTEDSVASAYLGGVLASSKTDSDRDDRGVCMNALISRLSVFQLRLHYVAYTSMHELLQGTEPGFYNPGHEMKNKLHYGTNGLLVAMGFDQNEFNDPDFNLDSAISHALYGLDKEELIGDWEFRWDRGFSCIPTPIGTELFLWANGHGRRSIEYFFDREFTPIDCDDDSVLLLRGREVKAKLDDGQEVTVNGFDYYSRLDKLHVCTLSPKNLPATKDA